MSRELNLYRMWENGEDYGTASGKAARMWLTVAQANDPCAYIERVPDQAPVFLPRAGNHVMRDPRRRAFSGARYRMWRDGEDWGTTDYETAENWLFIAQQVCDEACIESVRKNAPVFLDQPNRVI